MTVIYVFIVAREAPAIILYKFWILLSIQRILIDVYNFYTQDFVHILLITFEMCISWKTIIVSYYNKFNYYLKKKTVNNLVNIKVKMHSDLWEYVGNSSQITSK